MPHDPEAYDRLLEAVRPYMEGTDRTLTEAVALMPEPERSHAVNLAWRLAPPGERRQ